MFCNGADLRALTLERPTELVNPVLLYGLTANLAQEVQRKIQKIIQQKINHLGKTEVLLTIYELEDVNKRQVIFNTYNPLHLEDFRELAGLLIQKLSAADALNQLSFKPVNIDFFSNNFKLYINIENLSSQGIMLIKSGLSNFEQCHIKINSEIKSTGNSKLLDFLKAQEKKFSAFEKLLLKTLNSKEYEIRNDSTNFIKSLGFNIKNPEFTASFYMLSKEIYLDKRLRNFIKKHQRKKARKKMNLHKVTASVFLKKGVLEFLCSPPNPKKSKAEFLCTIVSGFVNIKATDQSRFIKAAVIHLKTEHSHQKIDFTLPKKTYEQFKKTAKNHKITVQDLINALVEHALSKNTLWILTQQAEILNAHMV